MRLRWMITTALVFALTGCAGGMTTPRFTGGVPINLPQEVLKVRVVAIEMSDAALDSHFRVSDPDLDKPGRDATEVERLHDELARELSEDIAAEVREELGACDDDQGRAVDFVIKVRTIEYAGVTGIDRKEDRLTGDAEIVASGELEPIGRYSVDVISLPHPGMDNAESRDGVSVSVNDREDAMGERLGRWLCTAVLKNNARPPAWRNLSR